MRDAIREIDPQLPFSSFRTMEEVKLEQLTSERFEIGLFAAFAFARSLRTVVWGVSTGDPMTFIGVASLRNRNSVSKHVATRRSRTNLNLWNL